MTAWHTVQRDFSGGVISPRMLGRDNTEVYQKSLLEMENWMPTMMGSARRMPGTRFMREIDGVFRARIMPYLTTANERSLLIFTPGNLKLLTNITDEIKPGRATQSVSSLNAAPGVIQNTVIFRDPLIEDDSFTKGGEDWVFTPDGKTDPGLGVWVNRYPSGTLVMSAVRNYPPDNPRVCTAQIELDIDYPTTVGTLTMDATYFDNPPIAEGNYSFKVTVSKNADMSAPLFEKEWDELDHPVGSNFALGYEEITLDGGAPYTGKVYIQLRLEALLKSEGTSDREVSNPQVYVERVQFWADNETELTEADLTSPYTAEDLQDLHYVQSPYGDPTGYKELVVTHPKHPPHRFYFDPGVPGYVFEPIVFANPPSAWAVNNYPATCTSYHGRLVLAGGQTFKVAAGDPVASVSETVWCTEVTKWDTFSTDDDVNPDDSIEFTAVYRSPIQWAFGGKTLLIGSLEYEYSASGEGIFAPGDLGVFLHTTHGSRNVQPAPFGEAVLFPADAGSKLRSFTYSNDDQSWVAHDLTLHNPEICYPGIVRLARVRNPHQMCWVVNEDGTVSIYNAEDQVQGWNTYRLNGGLIKDICVLVDENGRDVPFLTVLRNIEGVSKLYLEAIPNFTETDRWDYTGSTAIFPFQSGDDTLGNLGHLEGKTVMVYDEYRFIGTYIVEGGSITLTDGAGGTIPVNVAFVGIQHEASLRTLPPPKEDPGSASRLTSLTVRTVGSTRPKINGRRPQERRPADPMNLSPGVDLFRDNKAYDNKWTHEDRPDANIVHIEEHMPFRAEIIAIFAKIKGNSL